MESDESDKKSEEPERRPSVSTTSTSDPIRLKCRDLLSAALKTGGVYYQYHPKLENFTLYSIDFLFVCLLIDLLNY